VWLEDWSSPVSFGKKFMKGKLISRHLPSSPYVSPVCFGKKVMEGKVLCQRGASRPLPTAC
jgi:hypothetical protein